MKKLFKRYQRFIRYTSTAAPSVDQSLNRTFMELKHLKKALPPFPRTTPFNDIHHQSRQKIMRVAYSISLMRESGIREAI